MYVDSATCTSNTPIYLIRTIANCSTYQWLRPIILSIWHKSCATWASLVAQLVKNPPAVQEAWV